MEDKEIRRGSAETQEGRKIQDGQQHHASYKTKDPSKQKNVFPRRAGKVAEPSYGGDHRGFSQGGPDWGDHPERAHPFPLPPVSGESQVSGPPGNALLFFGSRNP